MLKQIVKTVKSSEVVNQPTTDKNPHAILIPNFPKIVAERLAKLQTIVENFLQSLDSEILKLNSFYEIQNSSLQKLNPQTIDDLESKIAKISLLESFIFLNYTGVIKILKKNEKLSGLDIKGTYLQRIASLSFANSAPLAILKEKWLDHLHTLQEAASNSSSHPSKKMKMSSNGTIENKILDNGGKKKDDERVLVTLTGVHGTDILDCAMLVISNYQSIIHDISFSRIAHNLTVGVLLELKSHDINIFKDFIEAGSKLDATVSFDVQTGSTGFVHSLELAPYNNKENFVAILLSDYGLKSILIRDLTKLFLEYKVSVSRGLKLSQKQMNALELKLSVPEKTDLDSLREKIFALCSQHGSDISLQRDNVFRKSKRVAVFDMDSTLIKQEVIDEIARHAGVYEQVKAITEEAMRGELDFEQSLRKRVSKLEGVSVQVLEEVRKIIEFTDGARELCKCLKKLGFKLAVVSGGFMPLANYVKKELGLDFAFANNLEVNADETKFTGKVIGTVVDAKGKASLLKTIAQFENVDLHQTIAVGDGANDLLMLEAAALGIAFNAKPKVQKAAQHRINQKSLINVMYLLGYTDRDIANLLA